jgi:uncharacterized membrane protein
MYSRAKILGHPIHPMLIAFPVAFYTATFACFIIYAASGSPFWFRFATVSNWFGVGTAAVAALPGLVDWTAIPRKSSAKRTGLQHAALNTSALVLFLINAIINSGRWNDPHPGAATGIVLSAFGLCATLPAGFLGWSLVQDHHVGVQLSTEQERLQPQLEKELEERHRPAGPPSYAGR